MFAHLQTAHLDNIVYLSPQDERNHWLQVAILTLGFQGLGFYIGVLGSFRVLGFAALGCESFKVF